MSEHTPGPWVVRVFPTRGGARDGWWVLDAIPDRDGKVVANAICQATGTNDDAEANAYVLAAAPDLLAACVSTLLTVGPQSSIYQSSGAVRGLIAEIQSAVAKANGSGPAREP